MEATTLKTDLLDKIQHADDEQITKLYGLVTNYLNSEVELEEWDLMPQFLKDRINEGLRQADAGLGQPASEAISELRLKHGLDG